MFFPNGLFVDLMQSIFGDVVFDIRILLYFKPLILGRFFLYVKDVQNF